MNIEQLKMCFGDTTMTIVEAMRKIDQNNRSILYIVDDEQKLIGSLSDGDIRRWIIKTGEINSTVEQAMFTGTKFLYDGARDKVIAFFKKYTYINSVPIIDKNRVVTDIIFRKSQKNSTSDFNRLPLSNTPVIIMAGGKGTRLYPYTKILPKPLIPIGNVPIVERIINSFREYGAETFYMILNYKKEMIKSYFSEFTIDYTINYVVEHTPLGTAGGIRIIDDKFDTPVMVTNCDILIRADYADILEHHNETGNALTIVSSLKNTIIPYGVIHSREDGIVSSMEEKPHVSYLVNTGMYVINAEYIERIPRDTVYNMTDLIDRLLSEGCKVGIYPISEDSFLDMGEFEEMKRMEEKIYSSGMISTK